MTDYGTIPERVARGAAWLDQTRPGWRDAIDLDELSMESACDCVCGQVFRDAVNIPAGDYTGFDVACELGSKTGDTILWAIQHGFHRIYGPPSAEPWDTLAAEWKRVIHASRVAEIRAHVRA